jgi:hypothetical protein
MGEELKILIATSNAPTYESPSVLRRGLWKGGFVGEIVDDIPIIRGVLHDSF